MYADIAKTVIHLTSATGIATIVSTAAKQAMPSYPVAAKGVWGGLRVARIAAARFGVISASGVLGGLVADQAMRHTDKKVDEFFAGVDIGVKFTESFVKNFTEEEDPEK